MAGPFAEHGAGPAGQLSPALRAEPEQDGSYLRVRQGDLVFAFGSPFDFRFSMSKGVVSGIGRSVGVIRDSRGVCVYMQAGSFEGSLSLIVGQFDIVFQVLFLFALSYLVKWWLRDKYMAALYQFTHLPKEESQQ